MKKQTLIRIVAVFGASAILLSAILPAFIGLQ